MPIRVHEDVPIMPVLDLEDVADDGVASQAAEEVLLGILEVLCKDL
jgi:hypothetical protein